VLNVTSLRNEVTPLNDSLKSEATIIKAVIDLRRESRYLFEFEELQTIR